MEISTNLEFYIHSNININLRKSFNILRIFYLQLNLIIKLSVIIITFFSLICFHRNVSMQNRMVLLLNLRNHFLGIICVLNDIKKLNLDFLSDWNFLFKHFLDHYHCFDTEISSQIKNKGKWSLISFDLLDQLLNQFGKIIMTETSRKYC